MKNNTPQSENQSTQAPSLALAAEQYSLLDTFTLLTASAVALSFGAPFLRGLSTAQWCWLLLLVAIQLGAVHCVVFHLWRQRKKRLVKRQQMLPTAGSFLGQSDFKPAILWGVLTTSYRWLDFVYLVCMQSMLVGAIVVYAKVPTIMVSSSLLVCLMSTINCILHTIGMERRSHHTTIEYYEKGICFDGVRLIPWDCVSVRPRQLQSTGIAIVYTDRPGLKNTIFTDCSNTVRQRLLELES